MKKEYFTELIDESIPQVKMAEVNILFTSNDFENSETAVFANILGVAKSDEYAMDYLNRASFDSREENLKALKLKEECLEYLSVDFLKECLHRPIAVNIPYGKSQWIIVLGFQQTGIPNEDTIVLFDIDTGKIFLQNLNSFLWMCENVRIIYRR